MRGGRREGAGRKRGSPNQRTAAVAQKVAQEGVTPLEFMVGIMRKEPPEGADPAVKLSHEALRFDAAKAAAPYVHPRLNAIEHTGKDGGPIETALSPFEEARLIMFALELGAREKKKKTAAG
jgi:hypothetical protein